MSVQSTQRTRSKIYTDIHTTLRGAEHVLLSMHRRPDGDTAGASLGLSHYLTDVGIDHTVFCVDPLDEVFAYLPGAERVTTDRTHVSPDTAKFDVLVVLDSGDLDYNGIGPYVTQLTHDFTIINIDHHATNRHYGTHNLVLADASSTCEIVHDLIAAVSPVGKAAAVCLLSGLITDTGGFTNGATTASSIATAGKLQLAGANLAELSKRLLSHRRLSTLRLWGTALERLHTTASGIAVTVITQNDIKDCQAGPDAVNGVSNFLNNLDDTTAAKAVLVLTELEPGIIKGSLRTTNRLIDVAKLATLLGGGGHKKAAGFSFPGRIQITDGNWTIQPAP